MRRYTLLALLMLALAGCGTTEQPRLATPGATAGQQSQPSAQTEAVCTVSQQPNALPGLTPVITSSELTVGQNRFALGILNNNTPIEDAQVTLCFFKIEGDQARLVETAEAPYYGYGLGGKGVYVARPTFSQAGDWGVTIAATLPGGTKANLREQFRVLEQGTLPQVGEPAISVVTPTQAHAVDLKTITSDPQPDPRLYQLSLDEALKQGRPVVLLFATPGYCTSAVCGPDIEVTKQLADSYGQQASFIHVEVFKDPIAQVLAEPMQAWRLKTEPWLFLIDAQGTIRARFEGGITRQEVEPELKILLS